MRILIIGPLPNPVNGCSLANQTFANYLSKKGYSNFLTINTNIDSGISGLQGKFSWIKVFEFVKVYCEIYKIFRVNKVYITPGQTFLGVVKYAPFILLSWLLKKPIITHIHGNFLGTQYQSLNGIKKKIFKFLISRSSAGIVLSKSLINNFNDLLTEDSIFIVENFATNDLISREIIKKNHSILKILWLSNLMKEKGILDFLDALIQLKSHGIQFEAKIAGKIEEGLDKIIYEKLKVLGKCVEYLGTIYGEQKKNELVSSNVFVFPTYYSMEGQPIALIEAMATGNIVVTTDHAGIPDIVTSDNGYLLKPNDIDALVARLKSISENLDHEIKKFSTCNQVYVKKIFTEEEFGKKIMNAILNISNPKN